jgi:maltose alpha-D-glucosyltransferase/alpha-amylase
LELSDLWWKNAIVYGLDVGVFHDGNGDGVGDFPGLSRRLDYLAGLGVTCLWLMPCYPSPGNDVADYYAVDPRYGTLGDFVEFLHMADERGIRVILDLVVNHTSVAHPWFQEARQDPDSPRRDWYVWSDDPPPGPYELVFPGEGQHSVWAYDEVAGAYYRHSFYPFQPDLNLGNPEVREEIHRIMGFWLELGVSGFRVDAAPYLLQIPDHLREVDPHHYLRQFRAFLSRRRGDAILLGEANLDPEEQGTFFGSALGDELHMLFNFVLNRHLMLALAEQEPKHLVEGLERLAEAPEHAQWLNFLRTHDELTLAGLNEEHQRAVVDAFGVTEQGWIYDRGIRRRLAAILGGDRHRIELIYSLLFSLPGAPMLLWGDEIGMGDRLDLPGRLAVRTPMQWSPAPNAGFCPADVTPFRPVVDEGPFSHEVVNVADQRRHPESLLNWVKRLIEARKLCPEIGAGTPTTVPTDVPGILIHRCDWRGGTIVAVHNLAEEEREVVLDLDGPSIGGFVEIFGDAPWRTVEEIRPTLTLRPYGYRWLRVHRAGEPLTAY